MAATFGDVLAALPTPFDERGELDLDGLDHLLGYLVGRGLGGFVLLSEVAEAALLDGAEQSRLVERVAAKLDKAAPFWVEARGPSTRAAIETTTHAEAQGAKGVLVSLPRLPGVGYADVYRHVDRVGRAASLPLLLSVRPGDMVSALTPEERATLSQHPRLAGVFVAESAGPSARSWARWFEGRGGIYGACSFELLEAARHGVNAAICGLAALAPDLSVAMAEGVRTGDLERVRRLQRRLRPLLGELGPPRPAETQGGVERLAERIARRPLDGARLRPMAPPGLVKEGLRLQGHRIRSFVRPPQPQVTEEDRNRLRTLMRTCELLA